jgi:hypothetical protein
VYKLNNIFATKLTLLSSLKNNRIFEVKQNKKRDLNGLFNKWWSLMDNLRTFLIKTDFSKPYKTVA